MARAARPSAKAKVASRQSPDALHNIRVGTIVSAGMKSPEYIRQILPYGFESFQLHLGDSAAGIDLKKLAPRVLEAMGDSGAVISCLGVYGNPLMDQECSWAKKKMSAKATIAAFKEAIDRAGDFGCDMVCGFTGRIVDKPIPESIPAYKKVFGELAKRAADRGVRLAFENCDMGGTWDRGSWNIALFPQAWELMFDALPAENVGLQWEPCHQMVKLIDPLPQLRKWVGKVFHLHGKDATVAWDVVREYSVVGGKPFAWHRTPGFGDTNWSDIITILRQADWQGSIDIEGWHDPVYKGELEIQGQVHGLNYLKRCRGGCEFIAPVTV